MFSFDQQKLDYHWVETGHIRTEYFVRALSWNLEGTRLLLGGRLLQLWHCKSTYCPDNPEETTPKTVLGRGATFEVGDDDDDDSSEDDEPAQGKASSSAANEDGCKTTPNAVPEGDCQ